MIRPYAHNFLPEETRAEMAILGMTCYYEDLGSMFVLGYRGLTWTIMEFVAMSVDDWHHRIVRFVEWAERNTAIHGDQQRL